MGLNCLCITQGTYTIQHTGYVPTTSTVVSTTTEYVTATPTKGSSATPTESMVTVPTVINYTTSTGK